MDNDAPDDVMNEWRKRILTQTIKFTHCDDDMEIFALQETP